MGRDNDRYARQEVFAPIGRAGQERLHQSRVAIIGCGALGTHLADALVRAGVGRLTLVDRDIVEWSNLQRQCLFGEDDARAGTPKAIAAAVRLSAINTDVAVEPLVLDFTADEARDIAAEVDLVLDGTDGFDTRYLINDVCLAVGIPWIYCAVVGATGATMNCATIVAGERTPCLRCVWRDPAPPGVAATCDTVGVLGGAVSVVAGMAAVEALKILVGSAEISRELRTFDLWSGGFDAMALPRDPDCPACGAHRFDWLDGSALQSATMLCGRDTVQVRPGGPHQQLDLNALAHRWRSIGTVTLPPARSSCAWCSTPRS